MLHRGLLPLELRTRCRPEWGASKYLTHITLQPTFEIVVYSDSVLDSDT